MPSPQSWVAPVAPAPIRATVPVPGSKSQTARALVLAALADGPSVIRNGLDARDTRLMRDGLRTLGVQITETGDEWQVTPPARFSGHVTVDCGLAGTVMRFLPALALLAEGPVRFDGDEQAYARPMAPLLEALRMLGATVESDGDTLPFSVHSTAWIAKIGAAEVLLQPVPQRPAAGRGPAARRPGHTPGRPDAALPAARRDDRNHAP